MKVHPSLSLAVALFSAMQVHDAVADPPNGASQSDDVPVPQHLRRNIKQKSAGGGVNTIITLPPRRPVGQGGGQPPFKYGEVVVSGPPKSLDIDDVVMEYLEYADLTIIKAENGREQAKIKKYKKKGKKAGLNYLVQASDVPTDTLYQERQWNFRNVQMEAAWDITKGTNSVIVAVLDSGLQTGGPDGIGCVVDGYNYYTDADGYHGTHVAGTVAQTTTFSGTGVGAAGLAPDVCIMPIKVLDQTGSGTTASIANGIAYAVANGAHVINMSLGIDARLGVTSDASMDPQIVNAHSQGVVVVAAAGNEGYEFGVSYPAIHPNVIAVGATGISNEKAVYTNYGDGLDIYAPGGNSGYPNPNSNSYVWQEMYYEGSWGLVGLQGTSMASPHVAAAAALILAVEPTATPDEVKTYLVNNGAELGLGRPFLQVRNSLDAVGPTASPSKTPSVPPTSAPTANPSKEPSGSPTTNPSKAPTRSPINPTDSPTANPSEVTDLDDVKPTNNPTASPSEVPSKSPSASPTDNHSKAPTDNPSKAPSSSPSKQPTAPPNANPSKAPSASPTKHPTSSPSEQPTAKPTANPSKAPSASPSKHPTSSPSGQPTAKPTANPSYAPSSSPSKKPTAPPTPGCVDDVDCDNGDFCDGSEICLGGTCQAGTPPTCDDGLWCNGAETCDAVLGCQSGAPPCSGECDEDNDTCVAAARQPAPDGVDCTRVTGVTNHKDCTDECVFVHEKNVKCCVNPGPEASLTCPGSGGNSRGKSNNNGKNQTSSEQSALVDEPLRRKGRTRNLSDVGGSLK